MLQSKRLIFQPIKKTDFDFMRYYFSNPEQTRFLSSGQPYAKKKVREWMKYRIKHWQRNHFGTFILQERISRAVIGYCGLEYITDAEHIEILYGLIQDFWGKGLGLEAAARCIELGFTTLELPIIYGAADPENTASIAILKKIGMTRDLTFNYYGKRVEHYSISRDDFNRVP